MVKSAEVTFVQGMHKDIDKSLMSNKSYLDAENFRLITTEGSTTGSLENIRGTKSILPLYTGGETLINGNTYYVVEGSLEYKGLTLNVGDSVTIAGILELTGTGHVIDITTNTSVIRSGQKIIGSCEIRDCIVLFTTNNTTDTPSGGRSCIYKLELDLVNEEQTSLTLLYDDNLNDSGGYLNFSTYYPIKAIGRYETSIIQKVYWTDGYNNVRYANIAEYLTTDGTAYDGVTVYYFTVDKFEFQPNITLTKPVLTAMTSGSLTPGVVQYAYQLYRLNGAETTISPLSDIIHITADSDTLANTSLGYLGSENTGESAGKGCKLSIANTTTGFNRIRLYRVHYATKDGNPTISIVKEMSTSTAGETVVIVDSGSELTQITRDEFNIASTELFTAQDLAVKDNILFAANIEDNSFDVDDFDCRAVRFKKQVVLAGSVGTHTVAADYGHGGWTGDITFTRVDDDSIRITIANFSTHLGLDPDDILDSVVSITLPGSGTLIDGTYEDTIGPDNVYTADVADCTITNFIWGGDQIMFDVNKSSDFFTNFVALQTGTIYGIEINYFWQEATVTYFSTLTDSLLGDITIMQPASDDEAGWAAAGWDLSDLASTYPLDYDGINEFNDPSNDYTSSYEYKYQIDGVTLGAEGPNIKIGFTTNDITLNTTSSAKYYDTPNGAEIGSYDSLANPYWSGKRSWQRDEVYRLYAVFHNEAGQTSFPTWICDLKFPSLKDTGYELTTLSTDTVIGKVLYPTVEFKSFPATAVSAQIYVVPRTDDDKSVLTQCIAVPTDMYVNVGVDVDYPMVMSTVLDSRNIVKLASPEILINRNITSKGTDYLDYVGDYNTSPDVDTSETAGDHMYYYKLRDFDSCIKDANNETDINASVIFTPVDSEIAVGSFIFNNYDHVHNDCYGGSGLVVNYANSSWTPRGNNYCIVNYRQNVFNSQYGGNTYEARTKNYCRPCSDVIPVADVGVTKTCYNGDTFICYFQYLDTISNLGLDCGAGSSLASVTYVPLESSINCDLRHDICIKDQQAVLKKYLMQEVAGEWEDAAAPTTNKYTQPTDLYLYNSVYSQESNLDYRYCKPADYQIVTTFDCRVKASLEKENGEISDNWTKFGINEYIDLDSGFGEVTAIKNINDVMFYWQDRAFGKLSINERSLITDNNSAQLVLGTGGVLDRYTYLSDRVGCSDKFSVVRGKTAVYWFDRVNNALQTYSDSVNSLSRIKDIQSYIDNNKDSAYKVISAYNIGDEEIWFTFYRSDTAKSYTLSYNELIGAFISRYTFTPTLYIPYKDRLLSTTSTLYCNTLFDLNRVFIHNSLFADRCYFYGLSDSDASMYENSSIKILFNPDYFTTKAFDNLFFISNLYNLSDVEVYNNTFDQVRCYNDYQNSNWVTLTYNSNIMRRERGWSLAVPRNLVNVDHTTDPDIFAAGNLAASGTKDWEERIRDKYMIVDLVFTNDGSNGKFVFNKIVSTYRTSYR